MRTSFMYYSSWLAPIFKIQSLPCCLRTTSSASASVTSEFHTLIRSHRSDYGFKLPVFIRFEPSRVRVSGTGTFRSVATATEEITRDVKTYDYESWNEFSGRTVTASTTGKSALSCIESIQQCDAQNKFMGNQTLKHPAKVFVIDLETTGVCRKKGRIIEIGIRDLHGGENSCFQTLVNPEQHIRNSNIHGITTQMVVQPHVPRMGDLIPILVQYIQSRLVPGELALFAAHNGRIFDVPFLVNEFGRCGEDIPSNWLFLDTLPLARELMKLNGSKSSTISLHALRKHYGITLENTKHRAIADVNLLSLILKRMTFDLRLTVTDLLERSFKAPILKN